MQVKPGLDPFNPDIEHRDGAFLPENIAFQRMEFLPDIAHTSLHFGNVMLYVGNVTLDLAQDFKDQSFETSVIRNTYSKLLVITIDALIPRRKRAELYRQLSRIRAADAD